MTKKEPHIEPQYFWWDPLRVFFPRSALVLGGFGWLVRVFLKANLKFIRNCEFLALAGKKYVHYNSHLFPSSFMPDPVVLGK